jgi:hypothetical protein
MRILGGLNIVFAFFGVFYSAYMVEIHWNKWPGQPTFSQWVVFGFLSFICMSMILYLAYLGIRLIRKDASALWQVCLVFVLEIIYFWADVIVCWMILPISMSTIAVGFWGIAESPLAPQVITGFPLIGIAVAGALMLVQKKTQSR